MVGIMRRASIGIARGLRGPEDGRAGDGRS